jgi:protein phosphatase
VKLRPGNAQHLGARREQQDAFGFSDLDDRTFTAHGGVLAALADGMGGMALGREAAQVAIATLLQHYAAKDPAIPPEVALQLAVQAANAAVNQLTDAAGLSEGDAGATLLVVVVHEARLYWIAVGDSRIYLCRNGELAQLNLEHIFARELWRSVATGNLSRDQLFNDPEREMLTSYLGLPELPELDYNRQPLPLQPGDRLLLCSDGLYPMLAAETITALLTDDPQTAADRLVEAALNQQHPHQDNVTAVILACDLDKPAPRCRRRLFGLSVVLLLLLLILTFTTSVRADSTIDRMKASTVPVFCLRPPSLSGGSGFIIGTGRHLVTAWHVADCITKGGDLAVLLNSGEVFKAREVWHSSAKDLAVLELDRPSNRPPVTFATQDGVDIAQIVYVIGFPGAADIGTTLTGRLVFPPDAAQIGRRHCIVRLSSDGQRVYVQDGQSANGVFLANGVRLTAGETRALHPGDRFYLSDPGTLFEIAFAAHTPS